MRDLDDRAFALGPKDGIERPSNEFRYRDARSVRFRVEKRVLLGRDRDLEPMTHVGLCTSLDIDACHNFAPTCTELDCA